jgi:hypothetical protein
MLKNKRVYSLCNNSPVFGGDIMAVKLLVKLKMVT